VISYIEVEKVSERLNKFLYFAAVEVARTLCLVIIIVAIAVIGGI